MAEPKQLTDTFDLTLGFRLGDFTVEPQRERIVIGEKTVHLEPKVMQVLVALARQAQTPVSRDDLLASVWSDAVVGDEVLSRAVSMLRTALGDERTDPKFIRTIPRHGYELIQPAQPLSTPSSKRKRGVLTGAVVVALVVLALLLFNWPTRQPDDKVILLMPLVADQVDQAGVANGLSDALHNLLSAGQGLQVVARSWSFALRDPLVAPQDLAAQFDTDFVLEGVLTQSPADLQLSLELIDAANGRSVWRRQFSAADAEALSALMVGEVQAALNERLDARIADVQTPRAPINEEAYLAYLQARHQWSLRGAEHIARAAELLDRSIRLNPEFGAAHLALAQVVALEPFYSDKSVPQQFTLARQHLATALEVEPALQHEAQALEGFMLLRSRDWQGAQEILQATLAVAPDYVLAHYWYAMFLAAIGDYSGASMHAQQAVMLDPTSPVLRDRLADALLWVGDIDAARAEFVRAHELGFSLDSQSKGYIVFLAQTEQFSALQVLLVNMQLPADWVAAFVAGLAFKDQRAAAVTATHAAIAAGQIPRELQFGAWVLLEQAQHAVAAFDYDLKSPDVELLWATQSVGLRKAAGYEAMLTRLGLSDEVRMSLQTNRRNR